MPSSSKKSNGRATESERGALIARAVTINVQITPLLVTPMHAPGRKLVIYLLVK